MASLYQQALHAFKRFPGIGQRTAERMVFHLLDQKQADVDAFTHAVQNFKRHIKVCDTCGLISEQNPCRICTSEKRDRKVICVVKNVQDAFSIERSGAFFGLYHVLGGLISPMDQIGEEDLNIHKLIKRLKGSTEIVFALEQTIEAEATMKTIREKLPEGIVSTRMAIGIPHGTGLEFVDEETLKKSLHHRTPV